MCRTPQAFTGGEWTGFPYLRLIVFTGYFHNADGNRATFAYSAFSGHADSIAHVHGSGDFLGSPAMKSSVVKRSVVISAHKTSVSLEDAFWKELKAIAVGRGTTLRASGIEDNALAPKRRIERSEELLELARAAHATRR